MIMSNDNVNQSPQKCEHSVCNCIYKECSSNYQDSSNCTSPQHQNRNNTSSSTSCLCCLQDNVSKELRETIGRRSKFHTQDAEDTQDYHQVPPALPPRPNHRSSNIPNPTACLLHQMNSTNGGIKKYVFWCCVCGGMATMLGALFLAVYFLLRSYTTTLNYFETIPTFVPAAMLIFTGISVVCLAKRKNRYSYLIKICGLCCLVCALTCVLVTITTTVIHMNRLQTLRECVYTQKTHTCTCYAILLESNSNSADGLSFIFDSTPDCEVIHGALYSCLRAMFGLSVSGILVCIFSCMLVYQLLIHEKKKMYWEQLEMRSRSFYQHQSGDAVSTSSSVRGAPPPANIVCNCCDECRYPSFIARPQMYPWHNIQNPERFWTPGRIGNFYSPNPGEDSCQTGILDERQRRSSGWNWRRLPWSRSTFGQRSTSLYNTDGSNSDGQYGFTCGNGENIVRADNNTPPLAGSYSALSRRPNGGVYVWGPPPPYSDPNSPIIHPVPSSTEHHSHRHNTHCHLHNPNLGQSNRKSRATQQLKGNYENTTEIQCSDSNNAQDNNNGSNTDTSSCTDSKLSHQTTTSINRKLKKRPVQNTVSELKSTTKHEEIVNASAACNHNPNIDTDIFKTDLKNCQFLPRLKGVENVGFQQQELSPAGDGKTEISESEMYFADVSSCCNGSVRNDGHELNLYDDTDENILQNSFQQQQQQQQNNNHLQGRTFSGMESQGNTVSYCEDVPPLTTNRIFHPLSLIRDRECTSNATSNCRIPTDISQNSLSNSVQTPMTETTDDEFHIDHGIETNDDLPNNTYLAPDAQYEVIQENSDCNLTKTISSVNNYYETTSYTNISPNHSCRNDSLQKNIASNITSFIQDIPISDEHCSEEKNSMVHAQCNS